MQNPLRATPLWPIALSCALLACSKANPDSTPSSAAQGDAGPSAGSTEDASLGGATEDASPMGSPSADSSLGGGSLPTCPSLTGATGSITDASGNVWTLVASNGSFAVDENGAPAAFTANVQRLVYVNQVVSHENTTGTWYAWNGSAWIGESDPTGSCSGGGAKGGAPGSDGGGGETYGALFFDDFVQSTPPVGPKGNATTWLSRFAFGGVEYMNGDGNVAYMCDPSPVGSNPGAIGYDPFSIGGGVLTIKAQSVASSGISNPAGSAWNSGTITSCDEENGVPAPGLFAAAHGYFEVRAKWPKGGVEGTPGWWPGVVLYPLPYNGQDMPGEIDFPECLGGDTSRSEWTVHPGPGTNYYGPGPVDLGDGSWHTVGADVQPNAIDFYMDGTKIFSNPPGSTWNPNQQWYFNLPMEVSQVGSWGGGLPNVQSPGGPDPDSWKLDYAGCWQDFATRQAQGPVRAPSSP